MMTAPAQPDDTQPDPHAETLGEAACRELLERCAALAPTATSTELRELSTAHQRASSGNKIGAPSRRAILERLHALAPTATATELVELAEALDRVGSY